MKDLTPYVNELKEECVPIQDILTNAIIGYTGKLDMLMGGVVTEVLSVDNPPINLIEKYFMRLSNEVYFLSGKVEDLGLLDSISKLKAQEVYNNKYLEHQHSNDGVVGAKKPTVAELTAVAESNSIYEKTVNDIYSRAYKVVKNKISSAETMISTLSKVYSHRMQESKLTTEQTERQILNESEIFKGDL